MLKRYISSRKPGDEDNQNNVISNDECTELHSSEEYSQIDKNSNNLQDIQTTLTNSVIIL
jgi:hypothetical protein